jgi:capsular polysaccharide biosynthesis protein
MGTVHEETDFSVGIDIINVLEKPKGEIEFWGNDLDIYINFWKGEYDKKTIEAITKNKPRIYRFNSFTIPSSHVGNSDRVIEIGNDKPVMLAIFNGNYLHSLYEAAGRILYLDYLGLDYDKKFLILGEHKNYYFSDKNYLEFGIDPEKDLIRTADFSELIVKSSFNTRSDRLIHLESYEITSKLLRSKFRLEGMPIDNLYVSRKNALNDPRFITDEEKIEKYYSDLGYKIIYNEKLTFDEQREVYKNAKNIVGISGTGLINILFAPDDCKLTEILTSDFRNDQVFEFVCGSLGNGYQLIDSTDADHSAQKVIDKIISLQ